MLSSSELNDIPQSVLFCCTMNSVRSPMCEGLLKKILGTKVYVDSAGVRHGTQDYLMMEVMAEHGIDLSRHHAKSFNELFDQSFDVIIALSPEAQHHAVEFTRTHACEVFFWHTLDPTIIEGSRDTKLDAYRTVRNQLEKNIRKLFADMIE